MRKISAILGTMLLTFFLANSAMAQFNLDAYFAIDTDLATSGWQGSSPVTGIAQSADVGFALYSQAWDNAKCWTVHFEWDPTKCAYRPGSSGPTIVDNEVTINGGKFTPAPEDNILGTSLIPSPATSSTGKYEITYAQAGAVAASTTHVGLIYIAVFRTVSTAKVTDSFVVSAQVSVIDETLKSLFLGTRYFYVNKEIDVKTSSWGEVKKQFKDF